MANPKKKSEKPKKEKKEVKSVSEKVSEPEKPNFRGIVRIAGKDIKGHVSLKRSLLNVRGLSHTLSLSVSRVLSNKLGLSQDIPVGELSDDQIEKIDGILFSLENHEIPSYLLNRNKNPFDGQTKHVIMNDLIFAVTQDVEKMKKHYSWKGYRHSYGQKVRGQRTRNTGRTGMAVGVLRKSIIAAQGGAAPAAGAAATAAKPGEAAAPAAKSAAKSAKPAAEVKAAPKPEAKK